VMSGRSAKISRQSATDLGHRARGCLRRRLRGEPPLDACALAITPTDGFASWPGSHFHPSQIPETRLQPAERLLRGSGAGWRS
jgi:hypothetical protein